MGNIGNENAVRRIDIPSNSSSPNKETRLSRDLSSSPHRPDYMDDASMIRRAAGKIPHICIVGAGVAGLRCADVLLQHGVKVTILEARNRVGGRLCQSNALGHLVDLGPNWIHGTDDNPVLELAKETKTVTMNWDGRQSVFDNQGNHVPDEDAAENIEHVWGIIEQAMKHSNEESATIPAEKSLYDFFAEQVVKLFPEQDAKAKEKQQTILQMAEMWGAFVGSTIQTQSLKFFWLEECIDGENLFVASTYNKVLEKIAKPALEKATVLFGQKVKRIISDEKADEADGKARVSVEIEGQGSMEFDEVVMTAPLGWLKRNTDAFVPSPPVRFKQAVANLGYGQLDKVYITFPSAFWETQTTNEATSSPTASHDLSKPNVTATTAPIHQSSSPDDHPINATHYPGFTHWTHPTYTPTTNPAFWNQEAVNLAGLPGNNAHPTLLFYTFGPTSLHIASLLSYSPPDTHTALLSTFFEPYFSRLPGYDAKHPECKPKAVLATAWANDELAGWGSYTNFQTGLQAGDQDVEVLRQGIPERGVWVAGEHCAPFVALGTVTGAWWSGEGVGRRVVSAWGLGEKRV
ncbi:amine oxidase [Decorospora gaudefroyi]|uniref:Amine oxidase n=1 Tax=Decorospora gaudefroyi TaxID=184978 RepID=A0A6A5KJL4_9PLEO|nr:amine oxidase [Decorospora gaudefroyi]